MKLDENTPGTILLGVAITLLVLSIGSIQCRMGLHSSPKRYELKEGAPEVPQWEIVEQEGIRRLLDPNGTVIGIVEVQK